MFLGNALNAVSRILGVRVRGGHETANFIGTGGGAARHAWSEIDGLTYIEFVRQNEILC